MEKPKKSMVPAIMTGAVLILLLPIIYLLVARVLLPMVWDEPHFNEAPGSVVQPD